VEIMSEVSRVLLNELIWIVFGSVLVVRCSTIVLVISSRMKLSVIMNGR